MANVSASAGVQKVDHGSVETGGGHQGTEPAVDAKQVETPDVSCRDDSRKTASGPRQLQVPSHDVLGARGQQGNRYAGQSVENFRQRSITAHGYDAAQVAPFVVRAEAD